VGFAVVLPPNANFLIELKKIIRAWPLFPFRERCGDIPILVQHFVNQIVPDSQPPKISFELLNWLETYPFDGNIRELQSMMFDAVMRGAIQGELTLEHISNTYRKESNNNSHAKCTFENMLQLPTIKQASETLIEEALNRACGNQSTAAKMLGITQPSLSSRLKTMKKRQ
jgi:transcriptional regulator with PAS, ATPase and Fis domain